MKKYFNIFNILIILSLLIPQAFSEGLFTNNVKEINFNKTSSGKPEVYLTLDKIDDVRIIKKDDLEYVILMPETSSSVTTEPSLEFVSDIIESVDIKTQPYVGNIKGYTKITIKTTKPVVMNAKTFLETPKIEPPKLTKKEIERAEKEKIKEQQQKQQEEEKKLAQQTKKANEQKANTQKANTQKEQPQQTGAAIEPQTSNAVRENQTEQPASDAEETENNEQQVTETSTEVQDETQEEQTAAEPQNSDNQNPKFTRSLLVSLIITLVLLILLFLLKRFNRKHDKINPNTAKQGNESQNNNFVSMDMDMPVHEEYNHQEQINPQEQVEEEDEDEIIIPPKNRKVDEVEFQEDISKDEVQEEINPPVTPESSQTEEMKNVEPTTEPDVELTVEPTVDKTYVTEGINDTEETEDIVRTEDVSLTESDVLLEDIAQDVSEEISPEVPSESEVVEDLKEIETESQPVVDNTEQETTDIATEIIKPQPIEDETENISDEQIFSEEPTPTKEFKDTFEQHVNIEPPLKQEFNIDSATDKIDKVEPKKAFDIQPAISKIFGSAVKETLKEPKQIEPINLDEIGEFDEDTDFNKNTSPDDVFGTFEDEWQASAADETTKTAKKPTVEKNDKTVYKPITNEFVVQTPSFDIPIIKDDDEQDILEESEEENNIEEESEENEIPAKNTTKNESDVVKSSYDFTSTKSVYLVDYEGTSVLMASIKDEFFILKKFDEIIDSKLVVRQTEKSSKKSTYIVRAGSYRCVIEVTMKNIELVLEL